MGAPYDIIPGVDSANNFPPAIRQALADSPELLDQPASSITSGQFADARMPNRLLSTATQITDWNLAILNGWYYGNPGIPNAPGVSYAIGMVVATPSAVTQLAWEYTTDNATDTKTWRRDMQATTWTSWYRVRQSEAELDVRYRQRGMTELVTEDLNTITTDGDYSQSQNADAGAAANYPAPVAGFLEVRAFGAFIFQTYRTYGPDNRFFYRQKYNTTWGLWKEISDKSGILADYVPRWKASTAYAAGDLVITPMDEVVTSKTARTSGTSWNTAEAANWSGRDEQMLFYNAGFGWSGGSTPWDAGPLTTTVPGEGSTQKSAYAAFAAPGAYSGSIKFLEPGIYDVMWNINPSGNPGTRQYTFNIVDNSQWGTPAPDSVFQRLGTSFIPDQNMIWEYTCTAINIRVPIPNLTIRTTGQQTNATTNKAVIKVFRKALI